MKTTDPMEMIIEQALLDVGEPYLVDNETKCNLDFYLINHDVFIDVKQFHSPRISNQMSRAPNIIAVQGVVAVQMLADFIRNGASK